jgi:hypothetical protein
MIFTPVRDDALTRDAEGLCDERMCAPPTRQQIANKLRGAPAPLIVRRGARASAALLGPSGIGKHRLSRSGFVTSILASIIHISVVPAQG